jgi:septal ring factor EnvC (AmiA/AmiB activator)
LDRGVVIETSGRSSKGRQMGTEIILPDEFKEGDNWRALMRRQSGRAKTEETKSAVILQPAPVGGHDGTCQQFRHAILQELVGVYKELETARKELGTAQDEIARLQRGIGARDEKVKELEEQLGTQVKARMKDAEDVATLELQVRELRQRKIMRFDNRGVQI